MPPMYICRDLGYELSCLHDILMSLLILPWPWCSFLNDLLTLLILIKNVRNIGAVHLFWKWIECKLAFSIMSPQKSLKAHIFAIWMWWFNNKKVKRSSLLLPHNICKLADHLQNMCVYFEYWCKKLLLWCNTTFQI